MTFFPNSLAFRLLSITAIWTCIALIVTGIILSTFVRNSAEKDFERLLLAHTFNLMGAIDVDDQGNLSGDPNLGDPRFITPLSGWYWTVSRAGNTTTPLLRSRSVIGSEILPHSDGQLPFDEEFRRYYEIQEASGELSQRLEAQLYVGDDDRLYQVMVAGTKKDVENSVAAFNRTLVIFFSLFGLGTILATYFVIRLGLKPLTNAAISLQEVREGQREYLEGEFPKEISPLAGEINALITANKTIVERARTQVGNLAHALKTPLAVILNDVRKPGKQTPKLVSEQTELMKSQVQTYLDRARIAAQRSTTVTRTPVQPVVEKLIKVMKKLSPGIDFNLISSSADIVFRGEKQDLEEVLGNLLENSSRFAKETVRISLHESQSDTQKRDYFSIHIEDDGEGLTRVQREQALKRGMRLDESQPGSGLGLSIVRDVASEYGGSFELGESELGGLSAIIFLPSISANRRNQQTK